MLCDLVKSVCVHLALANECTYSSRLYQSLGISNVLGINVLKVMELGLRSARIVGPIYLWDGIVKGERSARPKHLTIILSRL